nr:Chain E, VAL-LEU-GLU-ASP-ARG-ILE [Escherichia coli str. K-12 substr. MG1655]5NJC_F Chain F, VAL-LEU-GLU-ASP-ARG-ILE [Escherichia coli str. K-12 substr. MG1655]
VLEDRI